jgi:hypothetical protein
LHRNIADEALLKPFSGAHEKRLKPIQCTVQGRVQRSTEIVMLSVLAIALLVEIGIVVAEIATRARLVAHSLSSRRAHH